MKILDYAVAKKLGIAFSGGAHSLAEKAIAQKLGGGSGGNTGGGGSGVLPDKNTWEGVIARMDNGTYATDYAIGDCVPLDLGSEGVINMQIAAFDTDDLADGSGKAPVTFIAKEQLATLTAFQSGNTTTIARPNWETSQLRSRLLNTIKPLIPANVQSRLATVTKQQDVWDTGASALTPQTTEDSVWVPSYVEVNETYVGLFPDAASRIKYSVGGTASSWWLRDGTGSYQARIVAANGGFSEYQSYGKKTNYVVLSFCLA